LASKFVDNLFMDCFKFRVWFQVVFVVLMKRLLYFGWLVNDVNQNLLRKLNLGMNFFTFLNRLKLFFFI